MLAVFINCATVILGGSIGLFIGSKVSDSFKDVVFSCSGLITFVMGVQMALGSTNFLVLLIAMLLGGGVGYMFDIEGAVLRTGDRLQQLTSKNASDANFARGFMSASILFCSGAMAVVGSIQAGTVGDYKTILIKSVMDGCMAVVFGSIYGLGVVFSSLFVFVYQSFFTIAGGWLEPLLGTIGIAELSAAGGVLLIMIGLGLVGIKTFKSGNFTPALVFAPILAILSNKLF